jgi:hypothetical protein
MGVWLRGWERALEKGGHRPMGGFGRIRSVMQVATGWGARGGLRRFGGV